MKTDNIEVYGLKTLVELRQAYERFIEKTGGADPDFPMIDFGDKGNKVKGKNKLQAEEEAGLTSTDEEQEKPPQEELLNLRR